MRASIAMCGPHGLKFYHCNQYTVTIASPQRCALDHIVGDGKLGKTLARGWAVGLNYIKRESVAAHGICIKHVSDIRNT